MPAPTLTLTPNNGPVGTVVLVAGTNYTPGASITIFTFNGVTPPTDNTCLNAVVLSTGAWSGSFVVPASIGGAQNVVATDNHPVTQTTVFTVTAALSLNSTSGIVGMTVTATGSGYLHNAAINAITFDGIVPTHSAFPTPNTSGAFTMTFVVPADDRDIQIVTISGPVSTANANFTVESSLSVTPTFGSMGDAGVTLSGAGYTAADTITGFAVGGVVPGTETVLTQPVAADGSWSGTFTIPQVPTTGEDEIIASTADDTASTIIIVADWISIDIGKVLSECSDEYGIAVITVDPVLGIVTFDRSEGAAVTKTERHTSKNDPRTMNAGGTNQWNF